METMKVAIPVWQNRVAPVFDVSHQLKIIDLHNGQKKPRTVNLQQASLAHRLKILSDLEVNVLLCNGISLFLQGCLQARRIRVLNNCTGSESEVLNHLQQEMKQI